MNYPKIGVKFILDEKTGKPLVINSNNLNHYKIEVSIENIPDDVYAVNYQLDPSYINSFREETNKEEKFTFQTTSFGDFSFSASLQGKNQNYLTSNTLSRALRETYDENNNPEVDEAIKYIKEH